MTLDASWDNSGLPPKRPGAPLWIKVAGGCGLALVLLIGSCVGLGIWGFRKAARGGQSRWPAYVEVVKQLQDPSGTRALYEASPRLRKHEPDAAAFERKIAGWRPALQTPPDQMPSFLSRRAMAFRGHQNRYDTGEGFHRSKEEATIVGYRMADGRFLIAVWVDDQLDTLEFEKRDGR